MLLLGQYNVQNGLEQEAAAAVKQQPAINENNDLPPPAEGME